MLARDLARMCKAHSEFLLWHNKSIQPWGSWHLKSFVCLFALFVFLLVGWSNGFRIGLESNVFEMVSYKEEHSTKEDNSPEVFRDLTSVYP